MQQRDWMLITVGLALGSCLGLWVTRERPSPDPASTLTPAQVVQRQLSALRRAATDPSAIEECYRYASPANQEAVGSAEDFARLLEAPDYQPLIGNTRCLLGKPVYKDDFVTLLATVIDRDGIPRSFRFVLQRQSDAEFEGRWMTSGVYPLPGFIGRSQSDASVEPL